MRVLLAYATYSSGTQTVSELLESHLSKNGWDISRKHITQVSPDELSAYDLVIFGSPSWLNNNKDGQPHQFFLSFIDKMQGKTFDGKKFAIFGLGDTAYPNFCGAVHVLEEFISSIHGSLIHESLRIDGYYFNEEEHNKKIEEWAQHLQQSS